MRYFLILSLLFPLSLIANDNNCLRQFLIDALWSSMHSLKERNMSDAPDTIYINIDNFTLGSDNDEFISDLKNKYPEIIQLCVFNNDNERDFRNRVVISPIVRLFGNWLNITIEARIYKDGRPTENSSFNHNIYKYNQLSDSWESEFQTFTKQDNFINDILRQFSIVPTNSDLSGSTYQSTNQNSKYFLDKAILRSLYLTLNQFKDVATLYNNNGFTGAMAVLLRKYSITLNEDKESNKVIKQRRKNISKYYKIKHRPIKEKETQWRRNTIDLLWSFPLQPQVNDMDLYQIYDMDNLSNEEINIIMFLCKHWSKFLRSYMPREIASIENSSIWQNMIINDPDLTIDENEQEWDDDDISEKKFMFSYPIFGFDDTLSYNNIFYHKQYRLRRSFGRIYPIFSLAVCLSGNKLEISVQLQYYTVRKGVHEPLNSEWNDSSSGGIFTYRLHGSEWKLESEKIQWNLQCSEKSRKEIERLEKRGLTQKPLIEKILNQEVSL